MRGDLYLADANRKRLGETGGCEAVVEALKRWGKTEKDVALSGCVAIRNLAYKK